MQRFLLAMLLFCVLAPPAFANDGQWYSSLKGGLSAGPEAEASAQGTTLTLDTDAGLAVLGSGGYAFGNGLSVEVEASWRSNDLGDVGIVGRSGSLNADGSLTNLAFMANAAYAMPLSPLLRPYLMAGVGMAMVDAELTGIEGLTFDPVDDDKTVFAYQVGVGVTYPLTEAMAFDVSYRFFGTEEVTFDDIDVTNTHHTGLVGLTYAF